jgi:acetylornithine deacetylase/succinyl-diaminopimelate desuccinylase-like protein
MLPLFFLFFCSLFAMSQVLDLGQIDAVANKSKTSSIEEFVEFLRLPNDGHFPDHVSQNLNWLVRRFDALGFETKVLSSTHNPYLLVKKINPAASATVLFYAHVDGQPVDPSKWNQEDPYDPVLKSKNAQRQWEIIDWSNLDGSFNPEWRIFSRSSSDDKGPIMMLITALTLMEEQRLDIPFSLKVLLDLEEEMGSPGIYNLAENHKEELDADFMLIFDGPKHYSHRPSLTFGARGISTITLTVYGPKMSLHSGHYGNYAPNPALLLSQLLGEMKDNKGLVTIPGFYDGVEINDWVRELLTYVPDDTEEINRVIGIHAPEAVGKNYQEALQFPSLNIRGLSSGWVGTEVRTIVPDRAIAEIDIRTVPETDPERLVGLVRQYIAGQGYHIIEGEPTDEERANYPRIITFRSRLGYRAYRTEFDSPIGNWLMDAMKRASDEEPVRKRISGGSVPISPLINVLNIPAVTVPTVNPDNNQHSPNENLRLGNYAEGIKIFLAILTQPIN